MPFDERRQKARKTHRCRECLGTIEVGESYFAWFDEEVKENAKCCSDCMGLRNDALCEPGPAKILNDWSGVSPSLAELCEEEPFRSKFLAIVEKRRKWEPRPIGKAGPRAFVANAAGRDLPSLIVRAESAKAAKAIACRYWRDQWFESWEIIMACRIRRMPELDGVPWKGDVCEDEKVMRDAFFCCYGDEGEPCDKCRKWPWPGMDESQVSYDETSSQMLCAECRAKEESHES